MNNSLRANDSSRASRFHAALWLIGLALLINAVVLAWPKGYQTNMFSGQALGAAFPAPTASNHSTYVLPLRLGDKSWGLVLVDRRQRVFCVYRFLESASRLRLVAARDYRYDLRLHDYNNTAPTPAQVKAMVSSMLPPRPGKKNPPKNPAGK
ncbi:MAG: hypothetical protein HKL95_04195 [Phycisphaerae bacterium]|nr:hypothetical protein [Phycisphaerae bacterium]